MDQENIQAENFIGNEFSRTVSESEVVENVFGIDLVNTSSYIKLKWF